jgi:hypothetical protein
MRILSHRGFWKSAPEKNTLLAIERSVAAGFGTETDTRDLAGTLMVAHDPPRGGEPLWDDVVGIFRGTGLPLAVNVKADGLADLIGRSFRDSGIEWFAFDMSGPETIRFARAGLPYFTRHSDIEPSPILYPQAAGVWLDAFHGLWFDADELRRHLDKGKSVCVVSPELHGRDHRPLWDLMAPLKEAGPELLLCTDLPDQAEQWLAP